MQHPLRSYLKGKVLPSGRRIFTLDAVAAEAQRVGDDVLVLRCAEGLFINRQAHLIEMRYKSHKNRRSRARGDSVNLDARIGDILTGMYTVALGQAVGDDNVAMLAGEFVQEVAPEGVAALTRQSFEAQLADANVLLDRFDSDLAAHIDQLGLERHVHHLRELVPVFARELARDVEEPYTFSEVKKIDNDAREAFAGVVFQVLVNYADDPATRQSMLSEFHRQTRLLTDAYKRHRKHVDIDPNTGEVIADAEIDIEKPSLPAPQDAGV